MDRIEVDCYSGYRGEQEPRRLRVSDRWLTVRGIARRWIEPDARGFEVRAEDGCLYTLRHDEQRDSWWLVGVRHAES